VEEVDRQEKKFRITLGRVSTGVNGRLVWSETRDPNSISRRGKSIATRGKAGVRRHSATKSMLGRTEIRCILTW
jgi:hypothetical protein